VFADTDDELCRPTLGTVLDVVQDDGQSGQTSPRILSLFYFRPHSIHLATVDASMRSAANTRSPAAASKQ